MSKIQQKLDEVALELLDRMKKVDFMSGERNEILKDLEKVITLSALTEKNQLQAKELEIKEAELGIEETLKKEELKIKKEESEIKKKGIASEEAIKKDELVLKKEELELKIKELEARIRENELKEKEERIRLGLTVGTNILTGALSLAASLTLGYWSIHAGQNGWFVDKTTLNLAPKIK